MSTNLDVSELFYSLQGEGVSLGRPAVFLRLSKCNLCCGCGTLVAEGKATWTCDSQAQMREFSTKTPLEVRDAIIDLLGDKYKLLLASRIHLIITGGEPALYAEGIAALLNLIDKDSINLQVEHKIPPEKMTAPTYEVETNGTVFSGAQQFYERFTYVNCSPKLASSGMTKDKRIVPFALVEISKHQGHFFKFVITKPEDWAEIEEDFIKPKYIIRDRIFLMAGGASREELVETQPIVWEMAMREGVLMTDRLQVQVFNTKKGV